MQITSLRAYATPMFYTCLTRVLTSRQEPIRGSARARKGAARGLLGVLVGVLCLTSVETTEANNMPLKALANKQLTDKQYKCHNEIIYRESRWNEKAIGNKAGTKQTHGYYQIKSNAVIGKPYDYQFWMYWYYVASRYGYTEYEEPNYCLALNHLVRHGWQ